METETESDSSSGLDACDIVARTLGALRYELQCVNTCCLASPFGLPSEQDEEVEVVQRCTMRKSPRLKKLPSVMAKTANTNMPPST